MHAFTQSKRRKVVLIGALLVLVAALGLGGTILAQDNVTGTVEVTGGSLTMAASDNPTFTSVTLNGSDQTTTDDIDIDVQDLTGSGAGWNLQVTSTTFDDGLGHTLSTSATSITSVGVTCDTGSCTTPSSTVNSLATVPADTTAPTAEIFFNASADSGMGDFTISPTFELTVPATTYAGTYTSTMTITIASGPGS